MDYKIIYDRHRFPKRLKRKYGSWGCRGCGGVIPKGRTAWCSSECLHRHHPRLVVATVKKRDKGVCQLCGLDCNKALREWWQKNPRYSTWAAHQEWLSLRPPAAEYDHVIPFCEGGQTVLGNMRTLCSRCHTERTRVWRANRKMEK